LKIEVFLYLRRFDMSEVADVSEDDCTFFWGSSWTISTWRWRHLKPSKRE